MMLSSDVSLPRAVTPWCRVMHARLNESTPAYIIVDQRPVCAVVKEGRGTRMALVCYQMQRRVTRVVSCIDYPVAKGQQVRHHVRVQPRRRYVKCRAARCA